MSRTPWHEIWAKHALSMTERSRCDRSQIAAVIVSPGQKIVSTGYNGPPARWTGDRVLTDEGVTDDWYDHCSNWCERAREPNPRQVKLLRGDYSDCPALHAEMNALLYADPELRKRGTIYVTGSVCMACAKAIGNSGIVTITLVNVNEKNDAHRDPEKVKKFLTDCGVRIRHVVV